MRQISSAPGDSVICDQVSNVILYGPCTDSVLDTAQAVFAELYTFMFDTRLLVMQQEYADASLIGDEG